MTEEPREALPYSMTEEPQNQVVSDMATEVLHEGTMANELTNEELKVHFAVA